MDSHQTSATDRPLTARTNATVDRAPARLLAAFIAALAFLLSTSTAVGIPRPQDGDGGAAPGAEPAVALDAVLDDDMDPGQALEEDGPDYSINRLILRYLRENPEHPSIDEVMGLTVRLGRTGTGYVIPREGVPAVIMSLQEISDRETESYHASAIQWILESVRDDFVERGLLGVYVAPDPRRISSTGQDLRRADQTDLTILITTGIVTEMRTIGAGERVKEGGPIEPADRINNPAHARILEGSPFRPAPGEGGVDVADPDAGPSDLLRKAELDRYLFFRGRHPGRRVDASVAAAEDVGGIALDYLVTENNPLTLYAQLSNTGTPETDRWRQRFGLFHTQLTNNDDILSIDYSTASFDQVHTIVGSYEAPFSNPRLRWNVNGGYSEYTASEVGFFADIFEGNTWWIQGGLEWNIFQDREFFLDLVAGLRYENQSVDNRAFLISGDADFLVPYIGLQFERTTEWQNLEGALMFHFQAGDVTGVDEQDLNALGRTDPAKDWQVLRFAVSNSVFLEPLLNRKEWEDPTTPGSSTLAHEVLLSLQGQYAFDNRLIPAWQDVLGGLYTVRGYPQSVVAGDSGVVFTAEYRFHVPRSFSIQPEPRRMLGQPFRVAPQYVYGVPDWDLVLKGFVDVGATGITDAFFFEDDETLVGIGIGMDFLYKRNLSVRLDWGFVMNEIESRDVNSGSNRLNVVVTLMF